MSNPTGQIITGINATAYQVNGIGYDSNGNIALSGPIGMLGVFKTLTVQTEVIRVDTTSSNMYLKRRAEQNADWTATLEHMVSDWGATGLGLLTYGYSKLAVFFQEAQNGYGMLLYGGIKTTRNVRNNDPAMETIELENIGGYSLGASLFYLYQPNNGINTIGGDTISSLSGANAQSAQIASATPGGIGSVNSAPVVPTGGIFAVSGGARSHS